MRSGTATPQTPQHLDDADCDIVVEREYRADVRVNAKEAFDIDEGRLVVLERYPPPHGIVELEMVLFDRLLEAEKAVYGKDGQIGPEAVDIAEPQMTAFHEIGRAFVGALEIVDADGIEAVLKIRVHYDDDGYAGRLQHGDELGRREVDRGDADGLCAADFFENVVRRFAPRYRNEDSVESHLSESALELVDYGSHEVEHHGPLGVDIEEQGDVVRFGRGRPACDAAGVYIQGSGPLRARVREFRPRGGLGRRARAMPWTVRLWPAWPHRRVWTFVPMFLCSFAKLYHDNDKNAIK